MMLSVGAALVACGGDDSDNKTSASGSTSTGSGGGAGADGSGGGSDGLCEAGCVATLEADCDNGPSDQEGCVAVCKGLGSGNCGAEYGVFQDCAEGKAVTCDDESGIPIVEACASEQDDFIACING
jgi:hypothetical protein